MAELLSPNVFVTEVGSQVQLIESASTSGLGVLGYTYKGPANEAVLTTSYSDFIKKFGGPVSDSLLPTLMSGYFANGGKRAYVVRVVPGDAVAATAKMRSKKSFVQIETGDGATTAFSKTSGTTTLDVTGGSTPIVASTVTINWRTAGTPVVTQNARNRADSANVALVNGTAIYEARIAASSLPAFDPNLDSVVRGTVSVVWQPDAVGTRSIAVPVGTGSTVTTAANGQGSIVTFDHKTGFLSVQFAGTDIPGAAAVGNLTVSFTPASATVVCTDNGSGTLTGGVASGTITYATGAYSFTASTAPHNLSPVVITYTINAWSLDPVSEGEWGNDLRVVVSGSENFYTATSATYSRFDVSVQLSDPSTGVFSEVESFPELVFSDPTSEFYFADVINSSSDYLTVQEPGADEAPLQLNGLAVTRVVAGGDETSGNQTISATLGSLPIQPRSVVITYTRASDGTARTITDNGAGVLTGAVDSAVAATINYTTGALSFKTLETINGTSLVSVAYRTVPEETEHTEDFGDTAKSYTAGTNGTFDSSNYGASQFTATTLEATGAGVYALDPIDELLQVAIPDFAGDTTVSEALVDYCDARANLPAGADRFAILATPDGLTAQEAKDWNRFDFNKDTKFAAMYWPWVEVSDPLSDNRPLSVPPVLHVAGAYARTDTRKNVAKTPAGVEDGKLLGVVGYSHNVSPADRDTVYPGRVNPINTPINAIWGARTLSTDSDWKYINVRRMMMYVERSIYNSTQWVVFENNGAALWTKIKNQLNGFLTTLFNDGYFKGKTPAEAFFVTVDETNNDSTSIDQGIVNIDVGIAAAKPAEFVVFRFTQVTASA